MNPRVETASEPFVGDAVADDVGLAAPVADRSPRRASRAKRVLDVIIALMLFAGVTGIGYYFWRQQATGPAAPQIPTAPRSAPAVSPEPVVRNPIDAQASAQGVTLPPLADSDEAMRNALAVPFSREVFARMFYPDDIIRRFVATVDNLPRQTVAVRVLPVRPPAGAFRVTSHDGVLTAAADNEARYAPYVRLLDAVDTRTVVDIYLRFYPLFQQAYVELGYPNGYFNDRLVEVIDVLRATPVPKAPVALTQPKVIVPIRRPDARSAAGGSEDPAPHRSRERRQGQGQVGGYPRANRAHAPSRAEPMT